MLAFHLIISRAVDGSVYAEMYMTTYRFNGALSQARTERTIVAPYEAIAVLSPQGPSYILLRPFHGDVHVAVNRRQKTLHSVSLKHRPYC